MLHAVAVRTVTRANRSANFNLFERGNGRRATAFGRTATGFDLVFYFEAGYLQEKVRSLIAFERRNDSREDGERMVVEQRFAGSTPRKTLFEDALGLHEVGGCLERAFLAHGLSWPELIKALRNPSVSVNLSGRGSAVSFNPSLIRLTSSSFR